MPKKEKKSHLSEDQNKLTAQQIMMGLRVQLFNIIIYRLHSLYLEKDKKYFKGYCKKAGIAERKMRMIINGTYDGTIPDVLAMAQRAGLVLNINYKK